MIFHHRILSTFLKNTISEKFRRTSKSTRKKVRKMHFLSAQKGRFFFIEFRQRGKNRRKSTPKFSGLGRRYPIVSKKKNL